MGLISEARPNLTLPARFDLAESSPFIFSAMRRDFIFSAMRRDFIFSAMRRHAPTAFPGLRMNWHGMIVSTSALPGP
jgi:hypothetical protein